jgi:hypothetical protein
MIGTSIRNQLAPFDFYFVIYDPFTGTVSC